MKALTEFPSVLDNVAKNLNWTPTLVEAYHNQPSPGDGSHIDPSRTGQSCGQSQVGSAGHGDTGMLFVVPALHEVCHVRNDDLNEYHRNGAKIEAAEENCGFQVVGGSPYKQ